MAIWQQNLALVELLLKYGAANDEEMWTGYKPILYAVSEGNLELTKLLLKYGAYIETTNNKGDTPLLLAYMFNHIELQKLLVANGANSNLDEIQPYLFKDNITKNSPIKIIANMEQAHTNVEWLASHAFIQPLSQTNSFIKPIAYALIYAIEYVFGCKFFKSSEINNFFQPFEQYELLQDVLDVVALGFIDNPKFQIIFCDMEKAGEEKSLGAAGKNDILISSSLRKLSDVQATFIHEAWHYAMKRVFDNDYSPYGKLNLQAKKAYEQAIYKCLANIYKLLFQEDNTVSYNSTYELGQAIVNRTSEVETDMVDSFLSVYENYPEKDEHSEFIVRYEQNIFAGYSSELYVVIQPLRDYIELYVKPEMREYIAHHPKEHLLKCPSEKYTYLNEDDDRGMCVIEELAEHYYPFVVQ